jgi:hypothetical protein
MTLCVSAVLRSVLLCSHSYLQSQILPLIRCVIKIPQHSSLFCCWDNLHFCTLTEHITSIMTFWVVPFSEILHLYIPTLPCISGRVSAVGRHQELFISSSVRVWGKTELASQGRSSDQEQQHMSILVCTLAVAVWCKLCLVVCDWCAMSCQARSQNYEKRLLALSCLSACLSALNNSVVTRLIFIKLVIWKFFENLSKIVVSLKYDKNNGYFNIKTTYICDSITLVRSVWYINSELRSVERWGFTVT